MQQYFRQNISTRMPDYTSSMLRSSVTLSQTSFYSDDEFTPQVSVPTILLHTNLKQKKIIIIKKRNLASPVSVVNSVTKYICHLFCNGDVLRHWWHSYRHFSTGWLVSGAWSYSAAPVDSARCIHVHACAVMSFSEFLVSICNRSKRVVNELYEYPLRQASNDSTAVNHLVVFAWCHERHSFHICTAYI